GGGVLLPLFQGGFRRPPRLPPPPGGGAPPQPLVTQRLGQRDLVDNRAARGVDQDSRGLHATEEGLADEVAGLACGPRRSRGARPASRAARAARRGGGG